MSMASEVYEMNLEEENERLKAEVGELLQIIKKLEDTIQRLMDKDKGE